MNQQGTITQTKENHWDVTFPMILPVEFVSKIEDILFQEKNNQNWTIAFTMLPRAPFDYTEYQRHEESLKVFLETINNPRFAIQYFLVSSVAHFQMIETPKEKFPWGKFLEDPIIVMVEHFANCGLSKGGSVKIHNQGNEDESRELISMLKYLDVSFKKDRYDGITKYDGFAKEVRDAYHTSIFTPSTNTQLVKFPVASLIALTIGNSDTH